MNSRTRLKHMRVTRRIIATGAWCGLLAWLLVPVDVTAALYTSGISLAIAAGVWCYRQHLIKHD